MPARGIDWYLREILPGTSARLHDSFRTAIRIYDHVNGELHYHCGQSCESFAYSCSMHDYLVPPEDVTGIDTETAPWRTEYDVLSTLRDELGHDVKALGVKDDLGAIRQANDEFKPHIAFNLLEAFHEVGTFDQNVVSYLELLRLPYTGCNPRGMFLARDKALVEEAAALPPHAGPGIRRGSARPQAEAAETPDASRDREVADAGIVDWHLAGVGREDEARLRERVQFIHESIQTDAIVEQFIEGQELYCGVLGNQRLQVLPVWEMTFANMPEGQHRIATERVKWNVKYQTKMGIATGEAK